MVQWMQRQKPQRVCKLAAAKKLMMRTAVVVAAGSHSCSPDRGSSSGSSDVYGGENSGENGDGNGCRNVGGDGGGMRPQLQQLAGNKGGPVAGDAALASASNILLL